VTSVAEVANCREHVLCGSHTLLAISKVKVKLSLCFNWAPRHEGLLGEWRYSYTHFGSRWRWVVSFTPRLLYPQGRNPSYPLDRRLGGPQGQSGCGGGEEKNSQLLPGLEHPIIQSVAQRYTTELTRLPLLQRAPLVFNQKERENRAVRNFVRDWKFISWRRNEQAKHWLLKFHIRGPFEKFVDSPYFSESELCGGTVTVSFSK
jgi:hypothetical protein